MSIPERFIYLSNGQMDVKNVNKYVKKYGKNILIAHDPGMTDVPSEEVQEAIDRCKELGVKFHMYFVGPAMMSWSAEERAQCRFLARSVGIDTSENDWHDDWFDWGWKKKSKQQFLYYDNMGAYSQEIDNMDGPLEDDAEKFVDFYIDLSKHLSDNGATIKLMIKNLNEDTLKLVVEAVKDGKIRKDFFAEWAMFEDGTGDPEEQIYLSSQLGIVGVTPKSGITDTNNYGVVAEGIPRLDILLG